MPKKENIQQMFDSIAESYDTFNHVTSISIDKTWRYRSLKRFVDKNTKQEILDIACGTGDYSIAIAKAMNPGSHVTGVDLSEGMLKCMDVKVKNLGMEEKISIEQGDSENMRFEDNSFDCATIAFGIRNFENREKALREILRVLKPSGKLVILELSIPSNPLIRWAFNLYFSHIMPFFGGKLSGNKAAYKYLPASVMNFPKKAEWMKTMTDCGFAEVTHKAFSFGICRMYIGKKA